MAFLQNLSVKKVSFVRKAANKRPFLLLKSLDSVGDGNNGDSNNNKKVEVITVRKEIKDKLQVVLRSEKDPTKVVGLIKADETIKATEQELAEVLSFLELLPKPEEKKEKSVDLEKELASLRTEIRKRDLMAMLKADCAFAPIKAEDAVEQILRLEQIDTKTAGVYIAQLKETSAALQKSQLFLEKGSSRDINSDALAANYLQKINAKVTEVQKNNTAVKPSDVVIGVIKEMGPDAFDTYRHDFLLRQKMNV